MLGTLQDAVQLPCAKVLTLHRGTQPRQEELVVQGSKWAMVGLQLSWRCGVSGWYCSWAKQHIPPQALHQHPAGSRHGQACTGQAAQQRHSGGGCRPSAGQLLHTKEANMLVAAARHSLGHISAGGAGSPPARRGPSLIHLLLQQCSLLCMKEVL